MRWEKRRRGYGRINVRGNLKKCWDKNKGKEKKYRELKNRVEKTLKMMEKRRERGCYKK